MFTATRICERQTSRSGSGTAMGDSRAGIPGGNPTSERHSVGAAGSSEDHAGQAFANQAHLYVAFSDPAEHGVLPAIDQMFPRNSVQQQPLVAAESVRQALR